MNREIIVHYSALLCEKIDQHTDAFINRVDALHKRNLKQVEYLERMVLNPLDQQITYLNEKLQEELGKGGSHE